MNFIRFNATDGIELEGLLYDAGKESIVINIHGWAGNFYENYFIQEEALALNNSNISFLTINNRGHDFKCYLTNTENGNSIVGGGLYEDASESKYDIEGAINFCKSKGYKRIILQGHSSGAQKVINYAIEKNYKDVILLSPGDLYEEARSSNDVDIESLQITAKNLISEGNGDSKLDIPIWDNYFTAKTFINTLGKDGFSDVFPIMRKEKNPILEKYNGNLLIVVGTNDSYLNPYSNYEALEKWLKNNFINAKIDYLNLEGETHSFTNNTENFAKKLTEMVLKIL